MYQSDRLLIRPLKETDTEQLLDLNVRNRELFESISPVERNDTDYTHNTYRKNIGAALKDWREDKGYEFGIFLKESGSLIGTVSLFFIERKTSNRCMIGYSLDRAHNGNGYMTEAVQLVLDFAFGEAHFYRVEAGVMPRNKGSIAVLEKCGFLREGLERDVLRIDGKFEDHYKYSILATDPRTK
ncbi:ribosomal-protein-alanine N-acetyltransferase [Terribacillus aidingensis]|uniref:Ribosomal-protein-alanine N-acetyltransferase n=1 Tax=Terribacillus aidingensis TaxID=586416 RepID=A0A285N4Q6_9BACI|nr:GNAT family protein [Terribacillus aidingensis]SNZ02711.1 ribosomal-protein-alanine N-acetyltransferase [Terribacillus aidingensis]